MSNRRKRGREVASMDTIDSSTHSTMDEVTENASVNADDPPIFLRKVRIRLHELYRFDLIAMYVA